MPPIPARANRTIVLAALLALNGAIAGGCAQSGAQSLAPQVGQKAPDTYKPGQAYQLSKEELALDCKRLTGRMQIRILQARDASVRGGGTMAARGLQSVTTPIFGGTLHGADPAADFARDRAMLEAMNKQLAAKNCATFDLDAELQPRASGETPKPIPKSGAN
jgi:hypothetical protein